MIQEITYGGQSANPSDYESQDGYMAASINLINEDGALHPIFHPKTLFALSDGDRLLCIHETASFKHFIAVGSDKKPVWYKSDGTGRTAISQASLAGDITKAECIGNAVFILTSSGTQRYLWTVGDDGTTQYRDLSTSLPTCNISFGLSSNVLHYGADEDGTTLGSGNHINSDGTINAGDDVKSQFTTFIMGRVSKFLSEKVAGKGYFCMPFYVRYAYRLYDDSLTCHSAPILMIPSNVGAPIVLAHQNVNSGNVHNVFVDVAAAACRINMSYARDEGANNLMHYSDIIKSVDIFVSAPIYSFDPSGKCESFRTSVQDDSFGIYERADSKFMMRNNLVTIQSVIGTNIRPTLAANSIVELPMKPADVIEEDLRSCSSFYLLKSIPIEDLTPARTSIVPSDQYLNSLTTKEAMTDDYDSHDTIIAENAVAYNSRMVLSGLSKQLFNGYFTQYYANRRELEVVIPGSATDSADVYKINQAVVTIKRDGRLFKVSYNPNDNISNPTRSLSVSAPNDNSSCLRVPYFYHPDMHAISVDLFSAGSDGSTYKLTLPMKPHPMLNGAYYFGNFENQQPVQVESSEQVVVTIDNIVPVKNKLYVSEIENPFVFPASYICSVGNGTVLGVASAAHALSQGQFGSFPLYAFATDGVWALSVSGTGTFSAVQPIARDVCSSPHSITQLDGSVLFSSERGIMMVSGSTVSCISENINSDSPFDVSQLENIYQLHSMMAGGNYVNSIPVRPFSEFITGCRMIFDYAKQRVIVFNPAINDAGDPEFEYAYVLSLRSGEWAMMTSSFKYTVNSYPKAMAQCFDGDVVVFDDTDEQVSHGMFITRPIKFGKAGIYKSIHAIIQRGYFSAAADDNEVCTVVYASRDLFNWYLIGSSQTNQIRLLHGTPYKYFRFAGVTHFTKDKSLSGATVDVIPRELTSLH